MRRNGNAVMAETHVQMRLAVMMVVELRVNTSCLACMAEMNGDANDAREAGGFTLA